MKHLLDYQTNRFGHRYYTGDTVRFRPVNGDIQRGTIARFDRCSRFARAYGIQVSFSDSPYTVTIDDLFR